MFSHTYVKEVDGYFSANEFLTALKTKRMILSMCKSKYKNKSHFNSIMCFFFSGFVFLKCHIDTVQAVRLNIVKFLIFVLGFFALYVY